MRIFCRIMLKRCFILFNPCLLGAPPIWAHRKYKYTFPLQLTKTNLNAFNLHPKLQLVYILGWIDGSGQRTHCKRVIQESALDRAV